MGVEKERERTRRCWLRKSTQVFFVSKYSQEVRTPAPELCWTDKNSLAQGGWTKWEKADRQPVPVGSLFHFFFWCFPLTHPSVFSAYEQVTT